MRNKIYLYLFYLHGVYVLGLLMYLIFFSKVIFDFDSISRMLAIIVAAILLIICVKEYQHKHENESEHLYDMGSFLRGMCMLMFVCLSALYYDYIINQTARISFDIVFAVPFLFYLSIKGKPEL